MAAGPHHHNRCRGEAGSWTFCRGGRKERYVGLLHLLLIRALRGNPKPGRGNGLMFPAGPLDVVPLRCPRYLSRTNLPDLSTSSGESRGQRNRRDVASHRGRRNPGKPNNHPRPKGGLIRHHVAMVFYDSVPLSPEPRLTSAGIDLEDLKAPAMPSSASTGWLFTSRRSTANRHSAISDAMNALRRPKTADRAVVSCAHDHGPSPTTQLASWTLRDSRLSRSEHR